MSLLRRLNMAALPGGCGWWYLQNELLGDRLTVSALPLPKSQMPQVIVLTK
jgi:hypothetical protein